MPEPKEILFRLGRLWIVLIHCSLHSHCQSVKALLPIPLDGRPVGLPVVSLLRVYQQFLQFRLDVSIYLCSNAAEDNSGLIVQFVWKPTFPQLYLSVSFGDSCTQDHRLFKQLNPLIEIVMTGSKCIDRDRTRGLVCSHGADTSKTTRGSDPVSQTKNYRRGREDKHPRMNSIFPWGLAGVKGAGCEVNSLERSCSGDHPAGGDPERGHMGYWQEVYRLSG